MSFVIEENRMGASIGFLIWVIREDLRSEESSQDVAYETANSVLSEDIQRIVDTDQILKLGSEIAGTGSDNTKDDRGPSGDVSRRRRNGN